jgi:RecB family exonuclease
MPLVVIAGLPGDGIPQQVRDTVVRAASAGRGALLVVPADADAADARRALSAHAPVGVRVATFDGLIQAEWPLTGDGRRLVRGLARDVLLARALLSAGVAERPGRGLVGLLAMLVDGAEARSVAGHASGGLPGRIVAAVCAYRDLVSGLGMVESRDACTWIAATPPSEVIVVDGFEEVPSEYETLLQAWSDAGADVSVSLRWRPDCPGTAASTPLVDRLRARGATLRLLARAPGERPTELERVRVELFTGAGPGACTGAVSLAVTQGEEAEARHIAAVAAELVARGAHPETIAIVFADVSRRVDWVRRALSDAEIPLDVMARIPVGETGMGAALLALRACAAGGLDREDQAGLLRSPFSGVPITQADEADAAWRAGGTSRGRGLLRHVRRIGSMVDAALGLSGFPIGAEQAKKWKKLADQMLVNANPGAVPVPDAAGEVDAAVHRAFCRCLQEALDLGEARISADELWERFATMRVAVQGARRPGRALLTSIDRLGAGEFAHVIIGGLSAAEIPRRGSEDRLEGDAVSRAMAMLGVTVDSEDHARRERRAFYLAAASATESLTLTRQGTSDEGTPVRESVFWDEFLDLYRVPGDALPACAPPLLKVVPGDSCGAAGGERDTRGLLSQKGSLEEFADLAEISPSQIESYIACPYKWFIERRIGANAPDETLDRSAAGRLAHDALARFYREWLTHAPRVTPETREAAVRSAAEATAAAARGLREPDTLEESALVESVGPSVVSLVERDAVFLPGYGPEYLEWAFGGSGGLPAVDIGGVSLKGRADRIDVGPEGLVIVDYKRTNAASLKHIQRDGLVQLQLYAVAASRVLGIPVAGGLYRSLKDGSDRGFVLAGVSGAFKGADVIEPGPMQELLETAVGEARRVAGEMREGRIEQTPSADACRYCAASGFCVRAVSS